MTPKVFFTHCNTLFHKYLVTPISYLLIFMGIFFLVMMFSLMIGDLNIKSGAIPPTIAATIYDWGFNQIGLDTTKMTPAEKVDRISEALSWIIVVVTILTFIAPAIWYKKHKRDLKEAHVVEQSDIIKVGDDDVRKLSELLKGAKKAVIFAGSFDWILLPNIKGSILELAEKQSISLVTSKTEDDVVSSLDGNNADEVEIIRKRLVTDNKKNIRLTYVEYSSCQSAYCTMVAKAPGTGDETHLNMIIRSSKPGGAMLVDIISKLIGDNYLSRTD